GSSCARPPSTSLSTNISWTCNCAGSSPKLPSSNPTNNNARQSPHSLHRRPRLRDFEDGRQRPHESRSRRFDERLLRGLMRHPGSVERGRLGALPGRQNQPAHHRDDHEGNLRRTKESPASTHSLAGETSSSTADGFLLFPRRHPSSVDTDRVCHRLEER